MFSPAMDTAGAADGHIVVLGANFCTQMRDDKFEVAFKSAKQSLDFAAKHKNRSVKWETLHEGASSVASINDVAAKLRKTQITTNNGGLTTVCGVLILDNSTRFMYTCDEKYESNSLKPVFTVLMEKCDLVVITGARVAQSTPWTLRDRAVGDKLQDQHSNQVPQGKSVLVLTCWDKLSYLQERALSSFFLRTPASELQPRPKPVRRWRGIRAKGNPRGAMQRRWPWQASSVSPERNPIRAAGTDGRTAANHTYGSHTVYQRFNDTPTMPTTHPWTSQGPGEGLHKVRLHLIYSGHEYGGELPSQVQAFKALCVPAAPDLITTEEWKYLYPITSDLVRQKCQGSHLHEVAIFFQSADLMHEEDPSAVLPEGFNRVILCLPFDAGYVRYPNGVNETGRLRSPVMEDQCAEKMTGSGVEVWTWYTAPSQAHADRMKDVLKVECADDVIFFADGDTPDENPTNDDGVPDSKDSWRDMFKQHRKKLMGFFTILTLGIGIYIIVHFSLK